MTNHKQSEQDYLECILTLTQENVYVHRVEIANELGVSQAAVNKAIKLLVEKGYVYEEGKHLFLSENGRAYAEKVYEKHCLIRSFLQSLGVNAAQAEEDACRMEHVVSEETFLAMKNFLHKQ